MYGKCVLAILNITPLHGISASVVPLGAQDRHGERRYEAGKSAHNNGLCLHWQSPALFSLSCAGHSVCVCLYVPVFVGHVLTHAEHSCDKSL